MGQWSVLKTALVTGFVTLCIVAVIAVIASSCVTANRNADNHREQVFRECIQSGQSWVSGSCVRGTVVQP